MKDLFNEPEVLDLEPVRDNILLRFTTWGGGGRGRNFPSSLIISI